MKCKEKTSSGDECSNNAIVQGMCMKHFLKYIKEKQ